MKPLNVGQKIIVDRKIENFKDIEIWSDIIFLTTIVKKQLDKKKSKNLEKMSESLIRITFYFQEYSNNIRLYEQALSEYRLSKNRAIERARKAEKENEKLKNKITNDANSLTKSRMVSKRQNKNFSTTKKI